MRAGGHARMLANIIEGLWHRPGFAVVALRVVLG
jgi:hypothetical protein